MRKQSGNIFKDETAEADRMEESTEETDEEEIIEEEIEEMETADDKIFLLDTFLRDYPFDSLE